MNHYCPHEFTADHLITLGQRGLSDGAIRRQLQREADLLFLPAGTRPRETHPRPPLVIIASMSSGADTSIADIAGGVHQVVATDARVQGVYLFGSRARGEESAASDIDLGILFSTAVELREVVLLEAKLAETLDRGVDLVDLGSSRTFLALEIIQGERIYCADPLACDRFELYVLRRAGDLAHFEKERRSSLLQPAGSSR
jgi:predicted nucleotidyltransferase